MKNLPAPNLLAVVLAAVLAFAWGGLYWGLLSPRIARLVGYSTETPKMPASALVVGFVTRLVQAYGIAVILAVAGADHAGVAALGGAALFVVTAFPMMIGEAAFGPPSGSWARLAVAAPEAVVDFAILGAVATSWHAS